MYNKLPDVKSTPAERLQALKDAKELVTPTPGKPGAFAGLAGTASNPAPNSISGLIRVAEYITTGHDYDDTHDSREQPDPKIIVDLKSASGEEDLELALDLRSVTVEEATDIIDNAMSNAMDKAEAREAERLNQPSPEPVSIFIDVSGLDTPEAKKKVAKTIRKAMEEFEGAREQSMKDKTSGETF